MSQEATEELVLEFLAITGGISLWIDGGWGVDALLGIQTRPHSDLDIIIGEADLLVLKDLLAAEGYRWDAAREGNVFVSASCLWLDVHGVGFDERENGNFDLADGGVWSLPPSAFSGRGSIGGVAVQCLSPEAQVLCHAQGYEPTRKDLQDMEALRSRFSLALPPALSGGTRFDA
jgi:lincosamide nucleotidyltransferase A/C/D/E